MHFLSTPEFWVAVSFFGFIAFLYYLNVPAQLGEALDKRALNIRTELDEARKLREEAQAILADYKQRQLEATAEAEKIIAQAKREAEILGEETHVKLRESLERRTKLAEDKIAQAEAQAINDVRSTAVTLAVESARQILGDKVDPSLSDKLITTSISELESKLN